MQPSNHQASRLYKYTNMIHSCIKWKQGGKTEPSMGFEPMTPCDLASHSNH